LHPRFLTASSTILPLLVRGISATCTTRAGTCRGVQFLPYVLADFVDQCSVQRETVAQAHEKHDAHIPSQS
jgi:hypothetical protein